MTDIKKISPAVQQEVKTIAKMGAGKKKIDTLEEFQKLQDLAGRLETEGNASEKEYVKGLMVEYQNQKADNEAKAEEKKLMNQVTDNAKNAMKNIKKIVPDKKELNEAEARMVLDLIKNTKGEFNRSDIEFFKQELIKAGFGNLLNEVDKKQPEETKPNENNCTKTCEQKAENAEALPQEICPADIDKTNGAESDKSETNEPAMPTNDNPLPSERIGKGLRPRPNKPAKPISDEFNPAKPKRKKTENTKKYIIADTTKTHGQKIARDLYSEIHKPAGTMANNTKVKNLIHQVDKNTAYSFLVEYIYSDGDRYLQLNRDTYGLSDILNRITADEAKHLVAATLAQAKGMNLQDTEAYKHLKNLQNGMNTTLHGKSDPDAKLQFQLDGALTKMMNAMTNVIK